jgi:phosphatidylserine/phosphatidylglycerophosphate/cardiolipin synthase-like enzyme
MMHVAAVKKLLDSGSLPRFGAALWFLVGKRLERSDLAWASRVLGQGGEQILLWALQECSALSADRTLNATKTARFLEQLCTEESEPSERLPRLVWTLPPQHPLSDRVACSYLEAIIDVISDANRELLVTSPFLQQEGLARLTGAISRAMFHGVSVRVLTHEADDLSSPQSIAVEELRREAARIRASFSVYTSMTSFLLHAKLVIADQRRMILGSANLTGPGLSHNLEAGVILGPREATEMAGIVEGLIERGLVKRVFGPTGSPVED